MRRRRRKRKVKLGGFSTGINVAYFIILCSIESIIFIVMQSIKEIFEFSRWRIRKKQTQLSLSTKIIIFSIHFFFVIPNRLFIKL